MEPELEVVVSSQIWIQGIELKPAGKVECKPCVISSALRIAFFKFYGGYNKWHSIIPPERPNMPAATARMGDRKQKHKPQPQEKDGISVYMNLELEKRDAT